MQTYKFFIFLFFILNCLETKKAGSDVHSPAGAFSFLFFGSSASGDTTRPEDVGTLTASAADTNQVSLSFTVPSDNKGVSSFDIRYSVNPISSISACDALTNKVSISNSSPAKTSVSIKVSDLNSFQTYYFCIKAKDAAGNSSANWAFTTAGALTFPRYTAVGQNCSVWLSGDGISWSFKTSLCSGQQLNTVTFGNGLWVAAGGNPSASPPIIYTSSDGLSWTQRTCPGSNYAINSVAFGSTSSANAFAATGNAPAGAAYTPIYYSSDGMTWTLNGFSTNCTSGCNGNSSMYDSSSGNFLVSYLHNGYYHYIAAASISNLTSWTSYSPLPVPGFDGNYFGSSLAKGNGGEIIHFSKNTGSVPMYIYSSGYGSAWSSAFTYGTSGKILSAVYGAGSYVFSDDSTPVCSLAVLSSLGGTVNRFQVAGCSTKYSALAYSTTDKKFVAVDDSSGPNFISSATGAQGTWSVPVSGGGGTQAFAIAVRP
ncbi:MAG TPA: fibronectin type III domain-containing protein [Leptospiraceae bacterium]|nr:fibronectin type III domain-containing protein [Leptospiraceae bacterium]HMY65357.1 fibronectin type III domain-containing protein [Leptospiraceae bacterium]HNF14236.1 fibronectin type III domain-containing protein [Leptospiraceae bacterium]HNF23037.1 fibronectin type III domain-containing protein [Leptospiraceae bacterium]HNM02650.1 fibronectin type III domain-containing protein [Leptospiraceae bacterium]